MADRRYETLILLHPDQGESGEQAMVTRIQNLLESLGGKVTQVQSWGIREMAYPIAKQRRAFYVLFEYHASAAALAEAERNLKLMDAVIRFVSVRQAENAPPTPPPASRRVDRERGEEDAQQASEASEESL